MGRWAQASRRGSVGPADTQAGIPAPDAGAWSLLFAVTTAQVQGNDACPDAADGFRCYWQVGPDLGTDPAAWPNSIDVTCGGIQDLQVILPTQTVTARVAWLSGATPISPLGDAQDETL